MSGPSVSAIIINRNQGQQIGRKLDELLNQTLPPSELIVVDDLSTDNSREVIEDRRRQHPQVALLQNERCMGDAFSLQRAVSHASGDYLVEQQADGRAAAEFFEKSVALLERHPSAGLCCSNPGQINAQGNAVFNEDLLWSDQPGYFSPVKLADHLLGGCIPGSTIVYRRTAFLQAGGCLAQLEWLSSWFTSLVVAFRSGVCYLPENLTTAGAGSNLANKASAATDDQQSGVLRAILGVLKMPAYRDVLPLFARSGALSYFSPKIVHTVFAHPELWDATTLMLIQYPLWKYCQHLDRLSAEKYEASKRKQVQKELDAVKLAVEQAIARKDFSEALTLVQNFLQKYPQLKTLHVFIGQIELLRGNFAGAIEHYIHALQHDPANLDVKAKLGTAYFLAKDFTRARTTFLEVTAKDPHNSYAGQYLREIEQIAPSSKG